MGRDGRRVGPVGHAGSSFVYTAISSGLQSEKTCMDQDQGGRGPALPAPSLSMIMEADQRSSIWKTIHEHLGL